MSLGFGSSNKQPTTPTTGTQAMAANLVGGPGATEPGRIPVSTGGVNLNGPGLAGTITTKPQGVSGSDWKKYQSLTDKINNRSRPISDKNQQWYDNFVAKYGTPATPPGGGGGGGGGTPLPGGVVNDPTTFANVGLLTRPYDNPFERRDLWQLFPNAGGM